MIDTILQTLQLLSLAWALLSAYQVLVRDDTIANQRKDNEWLATQNAALLAANVELHQSVQRKQKLITQYLKDSDVMIEAFGELEQECARLEALVSRTEADDVIAEVEKLLQGVTL